MNATPERFWCDGFDGDLLRLVPETASRTPQALVGKLGVIVSYLRDSGMYVVWVEGFERRDALTMWPEEISRWRRS
jgi:hypothetical protein